MNRVIFAIIAVAVISLSINADIRSESNSVPDANQTALLESAPIIELESNSIADVNNKKQAWTKFNEVNSIMQSQQVNQNKKEIENLEDLQKAIKELEKSSNKYFETLPKPKNITFTEKVLNFEALDRANSFEDLPKYGLVPPRDHNHKAGKNLVLLAIKATSVLKGDWVLAHGLLGVSMLDIDVVDDVGYRSLFLSLTQRFKMYASYHSNENGLLFEFRRDRIKPTKSIITKREAIIYAISDQLNSRYIYDDSGNFDRNYSSDPKRKSNETLRQLLINGLNLYDEIKKRGFDDRTLRDTLGITYASLNYDEVRVGNINLISLGVLQVYSDALEGTLKKLKEKPNHSAEFLVVLGWEMSARGLKTDDEILLPENENNYNAIIKIIDKDLDQIKNTSNDM